MTGQSKQISLFSYANLVHAIAGGCGSACAMTTFYPLDIVRTRLQLEDDRESQNAFVVMSEIYKKEGIGGLYRGMLAGCVNVLATNPLWVVNTRIKMQGRALRHEDPNLQQSQYNGLVDGLIKLSTEKGVKALWHGTYSSLLLVVNPAIQFMTYEAIKAKLEPMYRKGQLSVTAAFLTGAVAKALATVLTYPIQLVQAKQRNGHNYPGLPSQAGLIAIIHYIIKLQGARGLYKGMEAKIIQTVLTAALMFVCYEKITAFVFTILMKQRKP